MKAIVLQGTLKKEGELSRTAVLSQLLQEELKGLGVESEQVMLSGLSIPPGTRTHMGPGDEWPGVVEKLRAADIIVFATPIWWGTYSSLIQRAVERLDELNDELIAGKAEFLGKAGGIVITGGEDGAQHIIAQLANFMVWNGLTVPPAASLSYLGGMEGKTPEELLQKFKEHETTAQMAKTMARNLAHAAKTFKDNPYPEQGKGGQYLR